MRSMSGVSIATPARASRAKWQQRPALTLGFALLLSIVLGAAIGPILVGVDPTQQNLLNTLQPPSGAHWVGTDQYGRDVLARLLAAARIDVALGFGAIVIPFTTGTVVGLLAGYYGGWLDLLVSALIDLVMAFPFYVLIISLVFVLGAGVQGIFVAVALIGWVSYARIVRGEVLAARRQEYVLAARAAGFSDARIIGRHILPNVITQAVVFATSDIVVVLVGIVTLGYLGLGIPAPTPDWGSMIFDGQSFITTNWQLSTIPGFAVVLTGLALSLIGDGLADALRPD
jgi:peptide/nickel transport system permease protein